MSENILESKIGLGGGCHWCTEAVFQALEGVSRVDQGWIKSNVPNDNYSEAVIVHFKKDKIDLGLLINIHLHTHSCTANHRLRHKYRSAVYTFNQPQFEVANSSLKELQSHFEKPIITSVLPFVSFKENSETYLNYYRKNPDNQFCQRYIQPKLDKVSQLME